MECNVFILALAIGNLYAFLALAYLFLYRRGRRQIVDEDTVFYDSDAAYVPSQLSKCSPLSAMPHFDCGATQ